MVAQGQTEEAVDAAMQSTENRDPSVTKTRFNLKLDLPSQTLIVWNRGQGEEITARNVHVFPR